jgi:hypothetical protein
MGWYATFDEEHDMVYFDETEKNRDQMRIDRDIYFFLKRFLNRETAKVGDKTRISWDFIANAIKEDRRSGYVGDTLANKTPNERKNYLKSCARRMEKKGWINVNSTARQLVIFFNVFHDCYQHYFVQKKDYPLNTPPLVSTNETDKPYKDGGYSDFSADAAPQDYPQDSAQDYPIPEDSISLPLTNNNNIIEDISNDHANVDVDYLQYEKMMQEEDTSPAYSSKANGFMNHDHNISVTTPESAKTPFNDQQDGLVSFFVEELKMSIRAVNNPDSLQHFKTWREQYSDDVIKRMVREARSMVNHKISVPKYFNYLFTTEQTNNSNLSNTQTNNMGYYDEASQQYIEQSDQRPTANRQPNRYQRKPDWQELYESATGTSVIW